MSLSEVVAALDLPPDALIEQRVPKKLLLEHDAPTASDRRQIQDGIEEITWIAALKPTNIGVPAYQDDTREYLEIAVLSVSLRAKAKTGRLVELIHRAVPYPVLLATANQDGVSISLAHKRQSQGEAGKVVIEDLRATPALQLDSPDQRLTTFLQSLALEQQPRSNLYVLYQGWIDRLTAFAASQVTQHFNLPDSPEQTEARQVALTDHERLMRELTSLRSMATKEPQISRRVALNLEIQRLEAELTKTIEAMR
ncbi:MAG: DUF4391 domain-containing protein [Thiobacillus sp.]|nr:DUF4391 domain-containing protein [Thiobacillus sp.]